MPQVLRRTHLLGYKRESRGMNSLKTRMNRQGDTFGAVHRKKGFESPEPEISAQRLEKDYMLVNWGNKDVVRTAIPNRRGMFLLNGDGVKVASNKLAFFKHYKQYEDRGLALPPFTSNPEVAQMWLDQASEGTERPVVVGRRLLTGHSGNGITNFYKDEDPIYIYDAGDDGNDEQDCAGLPLYVKYIPKQDEYRVHFFKGIDAPYIIQKKRKRNGTGNDPRHYYVRNHHSGWVYTREGVDYLSVPSAVVAQAQIFTNVTPLDFGALDIIYNRGQDKAYILECNTAPGLEGQTVTDYVSAFKTYAETHDFSVNTNNVYKKRT